MIKWRQRKRIIMWRRRRRKRSHGNKKAKLAQRQKGDELKKKKNSVLGTEIHHGDFGIHLDSNLVEVVANIRQYSCSNKGKTNPCTNKIRSLFTKETTIIAQKQQSVEMRCVFSSGLSWQICYSVTSDKWNCVKVKTLNIILSIRKSGCNLTIFITNVNRKE
jgi:hypothetical protein